ncbi:MAG: carboxylating nicotinate-nucleotide diphosphorylase [Nitrospirae bacterium]|nr:carboxylating nicotinate-nucleotide diphosphorylase [Nitrospirota bacterium]MBF0534481.1 carboxylating nicotinate-nucleotide diphosphorylase [Nitrospirota bacterium]MBF0617107.1 carboxylating nicotinate-nucleotide diphosphorylase [Nitrospirota bacterium]
MITPQVREFIRDALAEDIGHGDITTESTIDDNSMSEAVVLAKETMILAGILFFKEVFDILKQGVTVAVLATDGTTMQRGQNIARLTGNTASLLTGERVALNILQRLSGIATLTAKFVTEVKDLGVKILDTRKTTPNMRHMEKYAVTVGGGSNHRFGLYDGVLIKDNHIKASGGITKAVTRAKKNVPFLTKIEVEVQTLSELNEALSCGVDAVMLDNMNIEQMKEAVGVVRSTGGRILIEASGNVTLQNVRRIAETGVDVISTGFITHSAQAVDLSMKII